jgi:hypothetical protein
LVIGAATYTSLINEIFNCPLIVLREVAEVFWLKDQAFLTAAHVVQEEKHLLRVRTVLILREDLLIGGIIVGLDDKNVVFMQLYLVPLLDGFSHLCDFDLYLRKFKLLLFLFLHAAIKELFDSGYPIGWRFLIRASLLDWDGGHAL